MTTTLTKSSSMETPRFRARFNLPLIVGSILVGLVIYLAVVGPQIAPYDPLAENVIIKDSATGEWHMPPFKAFEVTGYPLGSDEFGRDLYSRLLWAIRPTLQMVAVVAAVRLVLGTLIGLAAGWLTGRVGQFLDSLISGALAVPGLLVALGTIAVVGVELGLIAFVIGLSVTGWAETARIVREQTRMVKSQIYIEAAHAMGASAWEIVSRHILRQIQAMLLMLLAFEIGSTLMLTAGLGFLGYYIGGDVWVDVSDFVARRTSGTPELGQMLATAWVRLTDPWGLVSVGSVVFALVLGFNLIGEGLRLRLNHEVQGGIIRWVGERLAGGFLLVEHYITYPIGQLMARPVPFTLFRLALGLLLGATLMHGWDQGWFKLPEAEVSFLFEDTTNQTPNPQGSVQSATPTPQTQVISVNPPEEAPPPEPTVVWTLETGSIFTGAPIVIEDGTIYATTSDNFLRTIAPNGEIQWELALPARPVGSPALAPDGTIYITDIEGALNALAPDGTPRWRYMTDQPRPATSGPTVSSNGNIYYALNGQAGMVQAVSPNGDGLWLAQGKTFSVHHSPQVSQDGAFVFLWNDMFNAADGTLIEFEYPSKIHQYLVGHNGKSYFRSGHHLVEWQWGEGAPEVLLDLIWDYPVNEETLPQEAGVTRNNISWELYTTEFGGNTDLFWVEEVEGVGRLLGQANAPISQGHVVFMDEESLMTVVCGPSGLQNGQGTPKPACFALDPQIHEPLWEAKLSETSLLVEAAYDPRQELLYITTETGKMYAVDPMPVETNPSPPSDSGDTQTNNGWVYHAPEPLIIEPILGANGEVYLLGDSGTIYALSVEGELQATFTLPSPPYVFDDNGFAGGGFFLAPSIMEDGSLLVVSEGKAYALNLDGSVRWEIPMERPAYSFPTFDEVSKRWYLLDDRGTLYAFTPTEGLVWMHDVEDGLRTASPWPVFGQNGETFYTITNGTNAMIEALAPDGTQSWRTSLTTFKFYRPLNITRDGQWLMVDDNLVNTTTSLLLETGDLGFDILETAQGYDGKQYLIAGTTVMEWEVNEAGEGNAIRVVNQVTISYPANAQRNAAPEFSVSKDGIYWLRLFAGFGRLQIHMWVNAEGEVLGLVEVDSEEEQIIEMDEENNRLSVCTHNEEALRLECRGYDGQSNDPVWQVNLEGIGELEYYFYSDGRLFIPQGDDGWQVINFALP